MGREPVSGQRVALVPAPLLEPQLRLLHQRSVSDMRRLIPSPAMAVALLALFVSLGGVSYGLASGAIGTRELRNNSIRSSDIRNGQVAGRDLRDNDVRGGDVRDGS